MKMNKKYVLIGLITILFALISGATVLAEYPEKPVKLIVPFKAGGLTDTIARLIQSSLKDIFPQPIVVVNIDGGGGVIGSQELINSDPDGYTMVITEIANIWTNKILGTAKFGPEAMLPVAQVTDAYGAHVVRADSRFKDMQDLVKELREKPNTVTEATNIGAIVHFLAMSAMNLAGDGASFRFVHIGGGADKISAILGGHVDSGILGIAGAGKYVKAGKMRALAVYAPKRIKGFENILTAREQGIDLALIIQHAVLMPKGTPVYRKELMASVLKKSMQDPKLGAKLAKFGMTPSFTGGKKLDELMASQGKHFTLIAEKYDMVKKK
jgi:tripartite-type tricarboxylate transporter receptor subunit TctC